MRPKILSPNVLSLVGEIGNVIHKTIKVVNIVTSKRSLTVSPWIFIINIDIHQERLIPRSGIYGQGFSLPAKHPHPPYQLGALVSSHELLVLLSLFDF